MRFHGIEMVGNFTNQKVADASALVWQASDEGRQVYDETTNQLYVADDSDWVAGAGVIPKDTAMWFYHDSAPTGWTIVSTIAADTALGVKSSAGTYTTGGTIEGSWAGLDHTHADSFSIPDHNHQWYEWTSSKGYTYQANGSSTISIGDNTQNNQGVLGQADSDEAFDLDGYTKDESVSLAGSVTSTSTLDDYRPSANVGILATKD